MRELVILGTASAVPTRTRNHNGYYLRWDGRNILLDPGEGAQRQCTLAGVSVAAITDVCISHFHGDHCLGLPGVIQRLSHDRVEREIPVAFPAAGHDYFDRLAHASVFNTQTPIRAQPLEDASTTWESGGLQFQALPLDHRIPTVGFQVREPDGLRFLPDRLEACGVRGPDVGALQAHGELTIDGIRVALSDVTEPKPGMRFAHIMDTRLCDNAFALAERADVALFEATFLEEDAQLAREFGHLTAAQAARIAAETGVRRVVLSHFSQRYGDTVRFLEEARAIHEHTILAEDLARIPLRA